MGSKTFLQDTVPGPVALSKTSRVPFTGSRGADWLEIAFVFAVFEGVLWTPRSLGHSLMIALVVLSVLWFCFRRNSRAQLGLVWPSTDSTILCLAVGGLVALAIPAAALLTSQPIPANPDWPTFHNLWPYVIWAFAQQFLLQSFFFLRLESRVGTRWAVLGSTALFTVAHLPNLVLTLMTCAGAVFFTVIFSKYRSIYPLGIVHALLGIAIAYSFPDSLMHHMRVGVSFWQF